VLLFLTQLSETLRLERTAIRVASTTSRAVTASARVLVVLSDGGDKASWVTRDEAVRKVQASNVVYTISLVEPGSRDANPQLLIARGGLPDRQARSSKGSALFKARRRSLKPVGGDEVAQWPRRSQSGRPVVVGTILGPALALILRAHGHVPRHLELLKAATTVCTNPAFVLRYDQIGRISEP